MRYCWHSIKIWWPGSLWISQIFSARATALLTELKIKVDWSYRDQAIFSSVVPERPAFRCDLCKSVSHRAKFCSFNAGHTVKFSPAAPLTGGSTHADTNSHETSIPWYSTIPCQNFNLRTCFRCNCRFQHICASCHQPGHPVTLCHT